MPSQRISSLCNHPNLWLDNEIISAFLLVLAVTIFNSIEWPGRTCGEGSQGSRDPFPGSGAHSPGMISCLPKQSCASAWGAGWGGGAGGGWADILLQVCNTIKKGEKEINSAKSSPPSNYFFCWVGRRAVSKRKQRRREKEMEENSAVVEQDILKILCLFSISELASPRV